MIFGRAGTAPGGCAYRKGTEKNIPIIQIIEVNIMLYQDLKFTRLI